MKAIECILAIKSITKEENNFKWINCVATLEKSVILNTGDISDFQHFEYNLDFVSGIWHPHVKRLK